MTWNPVTGCTKISHGCKFCYAERMANRLRAMGMQKYRDGFSVAAPRIGPGGTSSNWRQPRLVFVNSMSDLFHRSVPSDFIEAVFEVMNRAPQHTFQVLTKRPGRAAVLGRRLRWTPNIWMGTSIESNRWIGRLTHLRKIGAQTRFLSLEPLLGPLPDLDLHGVDWVIVGGESGPRARPMEADWVTGNPGQLRSETTCRFSSSSGAAFSRREREGRWTTGTWDQMPRSTTLQD